MRAVKRPIVVVRSHDPIRGPLSSAAAKGLAEGTEVPPENFGSGETMFQIFLLMASRRLMADRFYTENYNAATYTQEGLDWVDTASMKSVLVRNYPELGNALQNVDNAFMPWDGSSGRSVPDDFKK